jgi:hypothetical protein
MGRFSLLWEARLSIDSDLCLKSHFGSFESN